MDLEFEIQLFIESEQKRNGNKSGTSFVKIINEFSISKEILKPIIIKLYKNKKIFIRDGVNNKLIFYIFA
jgi:hypothetical protein